ncbi:hypothetical protein [Sphaerisporangium dianthi]|uniref:Uncharacterized protein n=1 Tax=Sphaerisporangium dianthi TaxID=1436120 RepID=A0ABV9CD48_9ACTN
MAVNLPPRIPWSRIVLALIALWIITVTVIIVHDPRAAAPLP